MTPEKQQAKSQNAKAVRNVLLSLLSIIAICWLIYFGWSNGVEADYADVGGLLFAIVAFPLLCILAGVIFFIMRLKKEGRVMMTAAGVFVLVVLFLLLPYLA